MQNKRSYFPTDCSPEHIRNISDRFAGHTGCPPQKTQLKGPGPRKADHVFQHCLVYSTKGNEKNEILIKPDKIEVFCAFFHELFFSVVFTVKGQCRGKYKVRDNFSKFHAEVRWAMK